MQAATPCSSDNLRSVIDFFVTGYLNEYRPQDKLYFVLDLFEDSRQYENIKRTTVREVAEEIFKGPEVDSHDNSKCLIIGHLCQSNFAYFFASDSRSYFYFL